MRSVMQLRVAISVRRDKPETRALYLLQASGNRSFHQRSITFGILIIEIETALKSPLQMSGMSLARMLVILVATFRGNPEVVYRSFTSADKSSLVSGNSRNALPGESGEQRSNSSAPRRVIAR